MDKLKEEMWCATIELDGDRKLLIDTMNEHEGLCNDYAGDWIKQMWINRESYEAFLALLFNLRIVKVRVEEL